jgi:hypothetical protein
MILHHRGLVFWHSGEHNFDLKMSSQVPQNISKEAHHNIVSLPTNEEKNN